MNKFNTRQICLFFIAILPVTKIFMLPAILSKVAGNDLWISLSFNLILDLITVTSVIFIMKKFPHTDYYTILENGIGKVGVKIIYAVYLIYFIIKAYAPILEQKNYVEQTLYETTPTIFTFLPFFIISFYLALKREIVLGRVADVLGIFTISGILLIFALSVTNVDLSMILPVGVTGINKIARGSFVALPWFGDAIYLLFLMGALKYEKKTFPKILISYLISGLVVIFFMIFFYGTFSSIAERQIYALSEISKYSAVISLIGRFDYVAIFGILFSAVFAVSLPLFFATECFKRVFNLKSKFLPSLIVNATLLLAVILLNSFSASIQTFILKYISWLFIAVGNILPIFTLLIKRKNNYETLQNIKQ